jgi:hypothetical protein
MSAVTPHVDRLDLAIERALDDPDWASKRSREPALADELLERARACAVAAFEHDDDGASDQAHRALYALYAQNAWSPVGAERSNQHDLALQAVLLELEGGFERWLGRHALPEEPPRDVDAFCAWLRDLALEREVVPPSGMGPYLRESATLEQLKEIVAQRSLFFLKEPDPWAMVIPSLHGVAKAGLLDVLLDEYGWGRHDHMHSTVYEVLMERLGLETGYDAYRERTAWQFLAGLNYQGLLARHRRLCRRMYGYIYLVEADSPRSMANYLAAWERLGIDDPGVRRFYELHVTADEGHQQVALEEMIAPVVRAEPEAAAEIARGVLEGHVVHALFSHHLVRSFRAGTSSLAEVV